MATEYLVKDLSGVCAEWTSEWEDYEEAACDIADEWYSRTRRKEATVTVEVTNLDTNECRVLRVQVLGKDTQKVLSNERKWG